MKDKRKRRCAVCETQVQSNVILVWQRDSDKTLFHICALCGESGKVNAETVQKKQGKTFTTYID